MSYSEDYYDDSHNSQFDNEDLQSKVDICKEYVSAGQIYAYLDNIEETIQLCMEYDCNSDGIYLVDAVLEIAPYNSEFWQYKGVLLNNMFEFEEAYDCFNRALSLNPSDVESLVNKSIAEDNLGMYDEAQASLNKALEIEPGNEEAIFNLGVLHIRKNNYDEAIANFKKAVEIDPEYTEAWYELGFCYENSDMFEEALEAYDRFLAVEAYSSAGWYNRGIVLIRMGSFEKAINSFELSIAIKDDFSSAWFNCGVGYANLGKFEDARKAFNKAAQLDDEDETIWYNLAQVYLELKNYKKALACYNNALKLDSEYFEAYLERGYCQLLSGNKRAAYDDLFNAILIVNSESVPEEEPSEIEIKLRITFLQSLLKNDFKNPVLWADLGDAHFDAGQFTESRAAFNKSLKLDIKAAETHYGKARTELFEGRIAEAVNGFKNAFVLNPELQTKFNNEFPDVLTSRLFIELTQNN